MDRKDELRALADVQTRLQQHFPELHADVVEAAVRVAHAKLDGPVRDFVPVLVEHAARDRLSFALRDGTAMQPDAAAAPSSPSEPSSPASPTDD